MPTKNGFGTLLIVGVGAVVVVILLGIILALNKTSNKPKPSASPIETAKSTKEAELMPSTTFKPVATKAATNSASNIWRTYSGNGIQFQYPSNWHLTTKPIAGGGNAIIVSIASSSANVAQSLSVEIYNPGGTTPQTADAAFSALGYTKSNIIINNAPASKYQGYINTNTLPLQETAVVFMDNNKTYQITFDYSSQQFDSQIQQNFTKFLASLRILQ